MTTILVAGALSLFGTLFGTKALISFLIRKQYGQFIRVDGPTTHMTKRGTPTMGGLVIMAATVLAYTVAHLVTWEPPTASALLLLYLFVGLGVIGFLDDWTKIRKQRSLGLRGKAKLLGQTFVAVTFAIGALMFPDGRGVTPASTHISFVRDISWLALPAAVAVIWMVLLIAGTSNAVNLTDGLDGLATGVSAMVFAAYTLLNIWQFNQWCGHPPATEPSCYVARNPFDLAVVALSLTCACFGFLWWNASPAKIFLGDTGSLSIGGAVAGLAILSRTEFLLVILGGLFVLETLSDIIQVGWFKISGGKRVFKMAPLHHHFEMLGWAEVTVVLRFWILAGLFVSMGMGLFYALWLGS